MNVFRADFQGLTCVNLFCAEEEEEQRGRRCQEEEAFVGMKNRLGGRPCYLEVDSVFSACEGSCDTVTDTLTVDL